MGNLGEALAAGWAAVKQAFGAKPVSATVQPCTTAKPGFPTSKPADCCAAPDPLVLPKPLNDAMKAAYANSFPGALAQEHGGTIVKTATGAIKVVNEGSGDEDSFMPNRVVGVGETVVGIFHTHPYSAAEGGYQGVSFSAADLSIAIEEGEPDYVDAGTYQFAIVPTGRTPAVSHEAMEREWETIRTAAIAKGMAFPEATRATALALAKKYEMAYYEGANGTLRKLSC